MISNLEEAGEFIVRGWALYQANPSVTISLDVFINGQRVTQIRAATFRSDLKAQGYGDGYHAFFFNPFDFLSARQNFIEVREASSSKQVYGGYRVIDTSFAANRELYRKARIRAQSQWRAPVVGAGRGDEASFLAHLIRCAHFHPGLRILEIGAGKGDLLHRVLKKKRPFGSYLGLDLSRASVDNLHGRYANDKVHFMAADAARYPFNSHFDLVIASSVCETIFPSFLPLFQNVARILPPGGLFAFDLVVQDDRVSISRAAWDGDNYLRLYSQQEIRRLLAQVDMELLQTEIYEKSPGQHRVFVTSLKLPTPVKNRFEMA